MTRVTTRLKSTRPGRPKTAAAPPWRRALAALGWRRGLALGAALILLAALASLAVAERRHGLISAGAADLRAAALARSAEMGLGIERVLVTGRRHTDRNALAALINAERGDPLLGYDIASARALVERLSWVAGARIERRLPGTLAVHLSERRPLAIWQDPAGQRHVIDSRGAPIGAADPERFAALPRLTGAGAPEAAAEMLALLPGAPEVGATLIELRRVSGRRWDLALTGGVVAQLPAEDAPRALARLDRLIAETDLLDRHVTRLDLRQPDRLIARRAEVTRPRAAAPAVPDGAPQDGTPQDGRGES